MNDQQLQATSRACTELAAAGQPVTFTTVAARSRVPRGTLYRNPALRAVIEEHRSRARQAATLPDITSELASQRLALQALAERVRRHEELLRKLTGKN
jgi:hypothetical protein